jgi:hypothetical protein
MRALAPAWPPDARCSTTSTDSPSEAAYTAVARPAGPAPTISTSNTCSGSSWGSMPMQRASMLSVGLKRTPPSGQTTSGSCSGEAP